MEVFLHFFFFSLILLLVLTLLVSCSVTAVMLFVYLHKKNDAFTELLSTCFLYSQYAIYFRQLTLKNWYSNLIISLGALVSWFVRPTPDRVIRVRALAGDIVLCSWARHFTLIVPLSTDPGVHTHRYRRIQN